MACGLFIKRQQEYKRQAAESVIPTLEINTDNKEWDSYASDLIF
ncbi:hypothetical protein ACTWP4_15055 [Gracilibacillus sp. D59]